MAVVALVPLFSWLGSSVGGALFGGTAATATAAATGGFAIGSAVGTAVGVAAGAYIDSTYLYPMLMPSQDQKGPRLDDLPMQTASEGSGMHYCLGAESRVAGTLIWLSPLIEVKREDPVEGGKGGGGGAKQTTYDYYLDIAIGVCEGPVDGITKIWADSKLIYDEDGSLHVGGTATGYSLTSFQPFGDTALNIGGGTGTFLKGDYVKIPGHDLYKVAEDYPGGDGTLMIENPGLEDEAHTGDSVTRISPTGGNGIWDNRIKLVRIYNGADNTPDSIIESYMGAGNVPAFKDTVVVVIKAMLLRDWGNRCPQFSFLVRAQTHESAAAGISNLLERAGVAFSRGEYNVDAVPKSVRGYSLTGPTETVKAIEPILQAYDILVQESNSSLRFFARGAETKIEVFADDLAAAEGDGTASRPFRLSDPSGFDLPREVNVSYNDPTIDWQRGSQRIVRNDANTTQVLTIDVPMTLHPSDAANLAASRLWRGYAERMQMELTLPPRYFHAQENDILTIPYDGNVYSMRIQEINEGVNHLLEVKGLLVGVEDIDESVECGARLNESPPPAFSAPVEVMIQDAPALAAEHADETGVYITAASNSAISNFAGAAVYASTDGTNFSQVTDIQAPASTGYAATILPTSQPGVWDTESSLEIEMIEGDLQSVTDERVYNGANRMWVGKELVAYRDATLIGPRRYKLTNFLRGLRSTPTDGHDMAELCVVVSPNTHQFLPLNRSGTHHFKVVQLGETLEDVSTQTVEVAGGPARQLAPIVHTAYRDTDGALTVEWFRRTRYPVPVWSAYKPLGSEVEVYEVDFGGLRTKQVSSPSVTYSAAEQTEDGLTPGDPVVVTIYQLSERVGRGYPAQETL
jgi:hypothetical protein